MIAVVSGLPRSGTSLLMQMLEAGGIPPLTDPAHAEAHRAPDASNPRGYYELGAVRSLRHGAPWIGSAEGHAVKVVAPLLTHLPAGPSYRVVFALRDVGDVVASQTAMLGRLGRPAGSAPVLRAAFARQVEGARALLEREARFEALYVEHADLVARPGDAAAQIAGFFSETGFGLDAAAMAGVVDPALHRSRTLG